MSFVQRLDDDPPAASTPPPTPEQAIAQDWFPHIIPADLRARHRIREAVTAVRWREALIAAIIAINNDLEGWRQAQAALGFTSLEEVPSARIDGASRLHFLYLRAVALMAKAEIVERYRDIDMSGASEKRSEDLDPTPGELRRDAIHAVRDILGRSRTTVDLI